MEPFTNEQIAAIDAIIERYFEKNRELILKRLLGNKTLDVQTGKVRQQMTDDGTGKIVFERL